MNEQKEEYIDEFPVESIDMFQHLRQIIKLFGAGYSV